MITNPNDPAQPLNDFAIEKAEQGYGYSPEFAGLTIREHIAAMAMQGLLANPEGAMSWNNNRVFSPESISELALLHADALIEALNKGGE